MHRLRVSRTRPARACLCCPRRVVKALCSAAGSPAGGARAEAGRNALVVGGGFAGLAAASVLTAAGVDVLLVEQGRGLGGRVCTRTVTLGSHGERLTFDHGCQYLTARQTQFDSVLEELHEAGVVAQWGQGGTVGAATLQEDDTLDISSFSADTQKALWVGTPTNSAVGRALAARAGPRLRTLTGSRVEALLWDAGARSWRCRLRQGPVGPGSEADATAATLQAATFDYVITAMSSNSTVRLLSDSSAEGDGDGGTGSDCLVPEVVRAAGEVRANVCWALMLALNKRIDVPFDGALISRPSAPDGAPQYGPIAWIARDSSKPGRPAVAGGAGEAWVVHAGPGWSNARRDAAPSAVAAELLRDFAHLLQVPISTADVVHMEAHRWNNAYPLNPRKPQPPSPLPEPSAAPLDGHFMLRPEMRLGVCGDWCKGPRAGDAYTSGCEAAHALLQL